MMLVGPRFSDGLLLRVAYAFQELVDWDQFILH
jgi:Asp-tRNA(Asn)/Glu-tRNA(Gln) amidotransferase A subunit family amidase